MESSKVARKVTLSRQSRQILEDNPNLSLDECIRKSVKLESCEETMSKALGAVASSHRVLHALHDRNQHLQKESNRLRTERDRLRSERDRLREEGEQMRKELKQAQSDRDEIQRRKDITDAVKDKIQNEYETTRDEMWRLQQLNKKLQDGVEQYVTTRTLRENVGMHRDKLAKADTYREELERALAGAQSEVQRLEHALWTATEEERKAKNEAQEAKNQAQKEDRTRAELRQRNSRTMEEKASLLADKWGDLMVEIEKGVTEIVQPSCASNMCNYHTDLIPAILRLILTSSTSDRAFDSCETALTCDVAKPTFPGLSNPHERNISERDMTDFVAEIILEALQMNGSSVSYQAVKKYLSKHRKVVGAEFWGYYNKTSDLWAEVDREGYMVEFDWHPNASDENWHRRPDLDCTQDGNSQAVCIFPLVRMVYQLTTKPGTYTHPAKEGVTGAG